MKKIIIISVVVVVLLVIGFLVYKQKNVENNNEEINNMSGDVDEAKVEIEKIINDIKAGKSNWDDLAKFYDGWYEKLAGVKDFKFYKSFDHGDKTSIYTYGIMPAQTIDDIKMSATVLLVSDVFVKDGEAWKSDKASNTTFNYYEDDGKDKLVKKLQSLVASNELVLIFNEAKIGHSSWEEYAKNYSLGYPEAENLKFYKVYDNRPDGSITAYVWALLPKEKTNFKIHNQLVVFSQTFIKSEAYPNYWKLAGESPRYIDLERSFNETEDLKLVEKLVTDRED